MFKAIEARTDLTERKKAIIKEVLTSYRKTAKKIASHQWKLFFQAGVFNRLAKIKHVESDLSERYKHVLKSWRKPSFKKVSLLLDSKCGLLESPKKAKHFDYWIRLSTKEKGKPIYLPVKLHGYFHSKDGELTGLIQISENGRIKLVKEVAVKSLELSGEVALDFGMECLFATDRGDLLGRGFYSKVKEYAEKIDKLQRNLQRQKIKPTQSKRYQRLNHKLSEYVKSEVRRILNRVVELYRPAKLVVEDLRYFAKRVINNFPKAVKRVLIRFGLGEIKRKLKELQEEYCIEVVYVNPTYTSQTCGNCCYVDKENRRSRSNFECKCCGKSIHADVNASRNLLDRVRWGMCLCSVKQAFTAQVKKLLENLRSERYKCLWGKARGLLTGVLGTSVIVPEPEAWNRCSR